MTSEGFLVFPYRGGFTADDDAHVANLRKLETWARGAKPFWSLSNLSALPPLAGYVDGTLIVVNGILYVKQPLVWAPMTIAVSVASNLYLYDKLV